MREFIRLMSTALKSKSQILLKRYLKGYLVYKKYQKFYKPIKFAIIDKNHAVLMEELRIKQQERAIDVIINAMRQHVKK